MVNMTLKGGTGQACAACKYQRKKCSSECPLAPFFPADQPKMFQNAHKLFGVKKITKILESLDVPQKQEAVRSIIYQANIRDRYPVHGCWGIICNLHYQISQVQEELQAAHAQLEMCRQQNNPDSQLVLGMAPPTNQLSLFAPNPINPLPVSQQQQQPYCNSNNAAYLDSKDCFWPNCNNNDNVNATNSIQSSQSQPFPIQHQVVQDYDELHPFFDTIDDRQSYIESEEPYESSSEESLKDTTKSIEHVADNELKTAAACFSLTSVH